MPVYSFKVIFWVTNDFKEEIFLTLRCISWLDIFMFVVSTCCAWSCYLKWQKNCVNGCWVICWERRSNYWASLSCSMMVSRKYYIMHWAYYQIHWHTTKDHANADHWIRILPKLQFVAYIVDKCSIPKARFVICSQINARLKPQDVCKVVLGGWKMLLLI